MSEVRKGGLGPYALSGKVAVVTGGSSGIGAASVRRLAEGGAKVVVGYNQGGDRAGKLVRELPGGGHSATFLPLEDSAAIRAAAAKVRETHGRCGELRPCGSAPGTASVAFSLPKPER